MKKIVTVIILTILVLGSFAVLSAPHVKAQTSGQAEILSYSWYLAPSTTEIAEFVGDVIVVGEVENTGTTPLGTVTVHGGAYNSSGLVCTGETGLIGVPELLPGQKAPFYLDISPYDEQEVLLPSDWSSTVNNVTVALGVALTTNQTEYTGLTAPADEIHGYVNSGTYTVTGTIENTGDQTVGEVWALVTYYNSSGAVVAMNCTEYADPSGSTYMLAPGNAVTFTATPMDDTTAMTSEIANYSVIVESSPYSAPSTTTPTSTPTSGTTSGQPTATSSSPTSSSPSNDLWTYGAVVILVVVVIAVVALVMLRSRRKTGEFEQPLPPPPPPPPPPE